MAVWRQAVPPLHVTVHGPAVGQRTPLSHAVSVAPPVPQLTMQPTAFAQLTRPLRHPVAPHVMSQKWPAGQVTPLAPLIWRWQWLSAMHDPPIAPHAVGL